MEIEFVRKPSSHVLSTLGALRGPEVIGLLWPKERPRLCCSENQNPRGTVAGRVGDSVTSGDDVPQVRVWRKTASLFGVLVRRIFLARGRNLRFGSLRFDTPTLSQSDFRPSAPVLRAEWAPLLIRARLLVGVKHDLSMPAPRCRWNRRSKFGVGPHCPSGGLSLCFL